VTLLAGRRRVDLAVRLLASLTALMLIATVVLIGLNAGHLDAGRIFFSSAAAVAVLAYAAIGSLIARRLPGNAIGWLLCLVGMLVVGSLFTEQYALMGLATRPGSLPEVKHIGALSGGLAIFAIILLIILVLVFPDGRLVSRRWRPVLWGTYVALAGGAAQQLQSGTTISGGLTNALQGAGVSYSEPLGVFPRHGWFGDVLAVIAVLSIASVVLTIASVFVRRRRGSAEVRQQLAWLAYIGALTVIWFVALAVVGLVLGSGDCWLGTLTWGLMILTPVVGIPIACAVSVLKYDGKGFDQTTTKMGSGVQGISDRLAALGGTVEIASAPGAGTRVTGRIPAIGR